MTATFATTIRAALIAALSCCTLLRAETTSRTLSGLRNFGPASAPQARVDTLSVTLDPATNVLHGKPGQTVGWGFNMSWTSNAGDSITFLTSRLAGDFSDVSTTGYKDIIGKAGGNTAGRLTAGSTWQAAFVPGTGGIGSLTISPDARPGTSQDGELRLTFEVADQFGADPRALKNFVFSMNVTVVVDEPDPVEPADQSITFAEIPSHSITEGTFTLSPSASSGLPVRLVSLQPDICTVEGHTLTIHSAGTCSIIADQPGNYAYRSAAPVTRSFEVLKAPATVTIVGSLDRNYTGADQTFTATTVPPALPVFFRYDGDTILPRDPGIYLVQAFIDSPSYTGTDAATLIITDVTPPPLSTYSGWLQTHFTPAQIQAGVVTGPNASPSGDEFNNLFKYALDFDPLTPLTPGDRETLLRMAGSAAGNSIVFDLPATAPSDITIAVEASSSLGSTGWQEIARRTGGGPWTGTADVFTGTPNATGTRIPILVTEPGLPGARRFYRLRFLPVP